MATPTFEDIWMASDRNYFMAKARYGWRHTRRYYKTRSIVRIAFWFPVAYLTLAMVLSLGL